MKTYEVKHNVKDEGLNDKLLKASNVSQGISQGRSNVS